MRVAITGASGFVGRALARHLEGAGHTVLRFARGSTGEIAWDPVKRTINLSALEGVDAVIHLAGRSIADGRWSEAVKEEIRSSRVNSTAFLISELRKLASPPKIFLSASAVGFYGSRGSEHLTEESSAGRGFLSEVCVQWEDAARRGEEFGARVSLLRFGIILGKDGGALQKMLLPFRLGLGGRLGSGDQLWSWISITDAVRAIAHILNGAATPLSGPMNIVGPTPVSNNEFTQTIARVLKRPAFFHVPAFALRAALGEMAEELFLSSTGAVPEKLLRSGFEFRYPNLEAALRGEIEGELQQ